MLTDLSLDRWLVPYASFLAGNPYSTQTVAPHISSLTFQDWKLFDLTEKGLVQFQTDKGITAIRRHVVLWHRPDQAPYTRHSDLGMTLERCDRRLQNTQEIVSELVTAEADKPETILGVHVDAVLTLDYMVISGIKTTYSIVARMCPDKWFPWWITDRALLTKLYQRRITLQSKLLVSTT